MARPVHSVLGLLAVLSLFPTFLISQESPDTTLTSKSDTLRVRFMPALGNLTQRIDSSSILHASQVVWTEAKYLGDLLWRLPGFYMRDLGELGKPNQLTAHGLDWRSIPILLDGRPLNDPLTGATNLFAIPLEAIEQVEPLGALDALTLGGQGNVLNLVTRQYNTTRPITNIRYLQGPFEYSLLDGLFTQNVARSTNLMLGVQRQVTDGRFTNSAYDSWHVRLRLRYNVSDRFNIALTELYSSSTNGMNGGIDVGRSPSIFDEVTALVQMPEASEHVSSHDVTLNGMARLFRDSLSTTQFALYYSSIERTYSDAPSNIADTYTSSLRGTRIIQQLRSSLVRTSLGFDLQQARFRKNDDPPDDPSTHTALFGKAEVALLEVVTPSIAARAEQRGNQSALSYGVGARVKLSNLLTLRAEIASSYRFPTFQERQGLDTTASLFNKQNVVSRNVGIQLSLGDFGLVSITGYEHRISEASAIFFIDANPRPATDAAPGTDIRGMSSSLLLRWWNLEGIGAGSFTETTRSSRPNTLLPKWTFTGEVAYRSFISTVAEIRAGVRVLYTSRHRGTQFFPRTWSFRENSGAELSESLRLDLFTVAKIGDAYVTVSWENLLNEQYMLVSGYPMPNRTFRFGVNWQFID